METSARHLLKESRTHGDEQHPFGMYWLNYGPGEHVIDCHWHEEAEIFYCMQGETLFQVDTDYFLVRAGEAVFVDGGDIHAAHAHGRDGCSFFSLVFDTNLLASANYDAVQEKLVLPLVERRGTFPRHIAGREPYESQLLQHIAAMMESCRQQPEGFEGAVKGRLYLMLADLAASGKRSSRMDSSRSESSKIERLKAVIAYIQHNYERQLRLSELAALIPMSEGHFSRFFKSMTRQSPMDYINSYRIRQAAELLREQERKISDIAMEVGYDNISYFIRVFRKVMHCSPSDFRKRLPSHDQ
ncbi:AraC family transcriptional regulator [Paenibacillus sp. PL2-23]|uniref:AraC family transcriptional regulator n=1 Tax=Paenibacillus sp. PL2-23 TaxID=2100729 RepID=UPI0030F66C9E